MSKGDLGHVNIKIFCQFLQTTFLREDNIKTRYSYTEAKTQRRFRGPHRLCGLFDEGASWVRGPVGKGPVGKGTLRKGAPSVRRPRQLGALSIRGPVNKGPVHLVSWCRWSVHELTEKTRRHLLLKSNPQNT